MLRFAGLSVDALLPEVDNAGPSPLDVAPLHRRSGCRPWPRRRRRPPIPSRRCLSCPSSHHRRSRCRGRRCRSATKTVARALPFPVGCPLRVEQRRPVVPDTGAVNDVPVELESAYVRIGAGCVTERRDDHERATITAAMTRRPSTAAAETIFRASVPVARLFVSSTLNSERSDASSGPVALRFPIPHICDLPPVWTAHLFRCRAAGFPRPGHALCTTLRSCRRTVCPLRVIGNPRSRE